MSIGSTQRAGATDRCNTVRYRRTGRSGLMLAAVSFDLRKNVDFDHPLDGQRSIAPRALDLGITDFDLARQHGLPLGREKTAAIELHAVPGTGA